MQIKKGPYGYYAIEKLEDPDRLCTYAEEVIAGNKADFYLAPNIDTVGSGIMCYFEFSGYVQISDPEFSVLSPDKNRFIRRKDLKSISLRRKTAGDLFYSFIKLLDNLVSPSCIVLDPEMIFTDPEGITIKICCLPLKSRPDELCLSSIDADRFEKLLNCNFFKSIITEDEANALVFSVRENNEDMFLKIADIIRESDGNMPPSDPAVPDANKYRRKFPHGIKDLTKSEKDLIVSVFSSFLSFALLIKGMLLPCFLFSFLSTLILAMTFLKQKKLEDNNRKAKSEEKSRQRSSILFSGNTEAVKNNSSERENERTVSGSFQKPDSISSEAKHFNPIVSGYLSLISDSKGVNSKYSIYLDETYIGSDCFLSDIVLDRPEIAPLHAVIKQKEGSFYLVPSKGTGKTYIEDSPVDNGKTYEIKSGQKITFGELEFRFSC